MKKIALIVALMPLSSLAGNPESGSLVWKHHVVWGPTDMNGPEKITYLERASCNHLIALPPEMVYKNWKQYKNAKQ